MLLGENSFNIYKEDQDIVVYFYTNYVIDNQYKITTTQFMSIMKDDYMLVSGCIGGIIGMFCDYKFPKSDTDIGVPYIIAFPVTAMTFYVFYPILIPGGMLILIDMGITYFKKNRE